MWDSNTPLARPGLDIWSVEQDISGWNNIGPTLGNLTLEMGLALIPC